MTNIREVIVFVMAFLAGGGLLFGEDAAIEAEKAEKLETPKILVQNFGTNEHGSPLLGDTYSGHGKITSARSGELVFSSGEDNYASKIPNALGNWLVFDSGDGLIEIYGKLDGENFFAGETAIAGDVLGQTGSSGWADDEGYYFSFYDRKERHWVNPALLEYTKEESGGDAAVIKSVKLRNENGVLSELGKNQAIRQGRWSVVVEAEERRGQIPLAPFKIITLLNGVEAGSLSLETFSGLDGVLMVYENGLVPAKQVYSPYPALEPANNVWFNRGQANLEIIVQTARNISKTATFQLIVN